MTEEEREQFAALERRVAKLEARLGVVGERPGFTPAAVEAATTVPEAVPPAAAPAFVPTPHRSFEITFGLNWISRIAVVTVVLALAFFFEYAFQNHWITEPMRVLLGVVCGAAGLIFGERLRAGGPAFGHALSAAGLAFLYLSAWAAFGLYHLIPQTAGFGLMVAITAAAGALALRYDSPVVAALGLGGGFATPLLLGGGHDPWLVLGYALVLDAGAAFAARPRRWRWVEGLAIAGTILLYESQLPASAAERPLSTLFVLAYYGLFATSPLVVVVLVAQVIAPVALAALWTPGVAVLPVAWLIAAAGVVVADRRGWSTALTASLAGFWLAYGIWYWDAYAHATAVPLAVSTGVFLMFLAWPVYRGTVREQPLRFQDLTLIPLNAGFYFGAAYGLLHASLPEIAGLFAVVLAVVQMAAARVIWRRDERGAMLAAGTAWVLLVLAAPIQFAGYRITIAWSLEGAALAWIAVRLEQRRAVAGALAVFAMVLLRLALVDGRIPVQDLVANARLLTFAVAAVSLWAAAWWIRGSIRESRAAFVTYLGGHIVMLWGACLEAVAWAERTAPPDSFRSFASTSISVLAGAYAAALVAGGSARGSTVTRLFGIGLIGLVIVKLYLYDVWLLAPLYRMIAFAVLGMLLLVVSFLYRQRAR